MNAHATCCCRATLDTIDQLRADLARVTEERDRVSGKVDFLLGSSQQADQDQLDLTNGDHR